MEGTAVFNLIVGNKMSAGSGAGAFAAGGVGSASTAAATTSSTFGGGGGGNLFSGGGDEKTGKEKASNQQPSSDDEDEAILNDGCAAGDAGVGVPPSFGGFSFGGTAAPAFAWGTP